MSSERIIGIEELMRRTETTIRLPLLSKDLGEPVAIRCRKIGRAEYLSFLPPPPPEAAEWPPEEFAVRERAWLAGLPPAELEARREAARDVLARVLARVTLEPALSVEQARRLGDDAAVAATEVLIFSGLLSPAVPDGQPVPGAPAEATEAAPAAA